MYGPKYVWILVGWYSEQWWLDAENTTDCTAKEVLTAAEGYFATGEILLYLHALFDVVYNNMYKPINLVANILLLLNLCWK